MKILFLTEFFPQDENLVFTGGVEARTFYLTSLAKKDFQVKVISRKASQVAATPFSVLSRFFYQFRAFFQAVRTEFDLVEGSNLTSYLPAFFAGRINRKPVIAWVPDVLGKDWFQFGLTVGLTGFLLEKIYLKLNWDKIIALSQSTRNKLIKAKIDQKKISVVLGGINLQEFQKLPVKKQPLFTIICIARLVATKRVVDLIQAFSLVIKSNPNLKLIIIGQGPKKTKLINLVNQLQLSRKVIFLHNLTRSELIHQLASAHLFCLPSIVEGFGIASIEALAAGLPIVVADIPINWEVTQGGKGALFFKAQDPVDLSDKLNQLIKDKKLYRYKQTQGYQLASIYQWKSVYNQTKKIYENCHSR